MKFFKSELLGKHGVTGWRVERWQRALEDYAEHFEAIKSRLPLEVVQFHASRFTTSLCNELSGSLRSN